MDSKLMPNKKIMPKADQAIDSGAVPGSRSGPAGTAHCRQLPATLLVLEPLPVSAYDDNPVFDEYCAARFVGVSADCLKKWRQRNKGPDFIRYGRNGVVRYELDALMEFRDKHRVRTGK
jgi:hypothetical protein